LVPQLLLHLQQRVGQLVQTAAALYLQEQQGTPTELALVELSAHSGVRQSSIRQL
jgi:hypothetical protein